MSRERREDVVTLVRGDPLLEPPDAGLGGDLADDARHAGEEIRDKTVKMVRGRLDTLQTSPQLNIFHTAHVTSIQFPC